MGFSTNFFILKISSPLNIQYPQFKNLFDVQFSGNFKSLEYALHGGEGVQIISGKAQFHNPTIVHLRETIDCN